jgi:DNA-binding CsgD family transcriptional regulator
MDGLSARDLRLLRDALDPALDAPDDALIAQPVLDEIARVLGCDDVTLQVMNFPQRKEIVQYTHILPDDIDDADGRAFMDAFWSCFWGSGCSHPQRTGDTSVLWAGSSPPPVSLPADKVMRDLMAMDGWKAEMLVPLRSYDADDHRLHLRRVSGPEFTERDVLVLELIRASVAELHAQHLRRHSEISLTPRQLEIMRLVATGSTNREIAKALAISEGTARTHLANIYTKLGATNRTQALAVAGLQV